MKMEKFLETSPDLFEKDMLNKKVYILKKILHLLLELKP